MDELYEKMCCESINEQMEQDKHINLSDNILILSDRLSNVAMSLSDYVKHITDSNVIGVVSNVDEILTFMCCDIDYLIIVGYLKNEKTYEVLNELRTRNKDINVSPTHFSEYS